MIKKPLNRHHFGILAPTALLLFVSSLNGLAFGQEATQTKECQFAG